MTETDLNNIEATFGIRLPLVYRQWALRLPPPDHEDEDYDPFICDFANPANLIDKNQFLRSEGWAPNHFCIGDPDGNHYFVDLDDPTTHVYYAQHDGEPYYDVDTHVIEQCRFCPASEFFTDEPRKFFPDEE
jgi:SMI1 / KNR4 family (SUKH-1)